MKTNKTITTQITYSTELTATIENLTNQSRNITYIQQLLTILSINSTTINSIQFTRKLCHITFMTPFAKDIYIFP